MGRLENKTVIISGGAGAQGASEALLCAKEGAKVIFGDVVDRLGQDLECSIRAKGGEATYVHLDVSSQSDWDTVLETAENKYGSITRRSQLCRDPSRETVPMAIPAIARFIW